MFEFDWLWAFLLLPLPWLVRRYSKQVKAQEPMALQVPFLAEIAAAQGGQDPVSAVSGSRLWWLACLIWFCLVTAAAKPQWLGEPIPQLQPGRELMMAIDLSLSMKERDFEFQGRTLDRLTATKLVAQDFIERRQGDRLGLVLFGEQAYLQAPLTYDRKTVQQLLLEAQIGLAGKNTAIGDAIGLSLKRLRETENPEKVLVLLTDGANTAGALEPLQAANLAQQEGVRIYTIGIGGEGGRGLLGSLLGNRGSDLDEQTLTAIAEATGGTYYRARDIDELAEIYQQLDQVEPVERDAGFYRPVSSLFHWPLALGLALMILLALIKGRS